MPSIAVSIVFNSRVADLIGFPGMPARSFPIWKSGTVRFVPGLNGAMLDKNKPLAGFRCWYCGRPLEERTNWDLFEEQFYCNALCREGDENGLIFDEESNPPTPQSPRPETGL